MDERINEQMDEQISEQVNEQIENEAPVNEPAETSMLVNGTPNNKYCENCGTALKESEEFCPQCGHKSDSIIENDVANKINQFNQGLENTKTKKKKTLKIVIIILSIVVVLAAVAIGGYLYFKGKADDVKKYMGKTDYTKAVSSYEDLGFIGEALFREELVDDFVKEVQENPYTSSSELVNETMIEKYKGYKEISNAMGITSEDGTNVVEYIDKVLELDAYVKYNEISACVMATTSDISTCYEYIGDASDSTYFADSYMQLAAGYASDAYDTASTYDTSEYLVDEYVDNLYELDEVLWDFTYGIYSGDTTCITEVGEIMGDVADVLSAVSDIIDDLPEIN